MLGAIIGSIVGSTDERGERLREENTLLLSAGARMTEATVCLAAVADMLVHGGGPMRILQALYRRHVSLGQLGSRNASRFVEDPHEPYRNSRGGDGAICASPVGLLAKNEEQVLHWVDRVTAITDGHPGTLEAARAVGLTVYWCRQRQPVERIAAELETRFSYEMGRSLDDVRSNRRPSLRSSDSVPDAILCGLHADNFEGALRNAVSVGSNTAILCTVAGAIGEARFGVPSELRDQVRSHLTPDVIGVVDRFYERFDMECGQVWHCGAKGFMLRLGCPMEWMQLAPTADVNKRHCDQCDRDVRFCATPGEFVDAAKADHCVAIPLSLRVTPRRPTRMLGMPPPWSLDLEDRARLWWDQVGRANFDDRRQFRRDLEFAQGWSSRQRLLWRLEKENELTGEPTPDE